jgi:hypothetical protein
VPYFRVNISSRSMIIEGRVSCNYFTFCNITRRDVIENGTFRRFSKFQMCFPRFFNDASSTLNQRPLKNTIIC